APDRRPTAVSMAPDADLRSLTPPARGLCRSPPSPGAATGPSRPPPKPSTSDGSPLAQRRRPPRPPPRPPAEEELRPTCLSTDALAKPLRPPRRGGFVRLLGARSETDGRFDGAGRGSAV